MRNGLARSVDRTLIHRVRSEYLEMPGLSLTVDQAARLWSVERATCAVVLEVLVTDGFLLLSRRGVYVRATSA